VQQRALAFHEDHVVACFVALQHEALHFAGHEVAGDGVERGAFAEDEDAGLAGGHKPRLQTAAARFFLQLEGGGHFADVAVAAHHQADVGTGVEGVGAGNLKIGLSAAHVPNEAAVLEGHVGEFFIVAEEVVQSAPDFEAVFEGVEDGAAKLLREASAGGGDAHHHHLGVEVKRVAHVGNHGDGSAPAEDILHGASGVHAVDYGHHIVGRIAQNSGGGFSGEGRELAFGQNDDTFFGCHIGGWWAISARRRARRART
jgi:hypothetical protein